MTRPLKNAIVCGAVAAMLFAACSANALAQTRIRGTIAAASGDTIAVETADGKTHDVAVTDKTALVFAQPIALSEIKRGDFLGVTSVKRADGTLLAYDLRRMMKPVNPGHGPFDGRDDQTMTNATVSATVDATKGRELVLTYDGGSQTVIVADGAAISALTPGTRAQLVPRSYVSLVADTGADGKLVARRIEVRKDAPKVP